jgi:hypothetical protein
MKTICFGGMFGRSTAGLGLALLMCGAVHAQTMKVEAQLVWGTDDAVSPNPKHHPIDADLARRLQKAPYRWKNYFEVNRQIVEVRVGETKTNIPMSKRCTLDIKNLGENRVEVKLHGDGKPVSTHRESLAKNGMFVLGGDAGNQTAWFVTIRKRDEPMAAK